MIRDCVQARNLQCMMETEEEKDENSEINSIDKRKPERPRLCRESFKSVSIDSWMARNKSLWLHAQGDSVSSKYAKGR